MNSTTFKVLICDDSIFSRKLMADTIREYSTCSYEPIIYEAKNGQEAIDVYIKLMPDIVFMDITMPIKSGIEALAEIKQFDHSAKVVIVSSSITESHTKQIIDGGAYSIVQKPFKKDEIMSILDRLTNVKDGE